MQLRLPLAALAGLLLAVSTNAQPTFTVEYQPGERLTIVERANLRRYENGRFVGLAAREVRGLMTVRRAESGTAVDGEYWVFEETRRDSNLVAKRLDEVVPTSFRLQPDGTYVVADSERFPTMRSFPTFPAKAVTVGEQWEGFGVQVVDPFRDGRITRVRFISQFTYTGRQVLDGVEYDVITAQYAPRYRQGQDPAGDPRIVRISGRHLVTIYYDPQRRRPAFLRDNIDETYELAGGDTIGYRGFNLTWYDPVVSLDRSRVVGDVQRALEDAGVEHVALGAPAGGDTGGDSAGTDGAAHSAGGSAGAGSGTAPGADSSTAAGTAGAGDGAASGAGSNTAAGAGSGAAPGDGSNTAARAAGATGSGATSGAGGGRAGSGGRGRDDGSGGIAAGGGAGSGASGRAGDTAGAGAGSGAGGAGGVRGAGSASSDDLADRLARAGGAAGRGVDDTAASGLAGPVDVPVSVENRPDGIALTLHRIRFVADRAEVVAEDRRLLATIATALAPIEDRTFLVVGHTADVGRPEGQLALSEQRAKAVVDALVAAGVPARRFIYEGRGGTQPVAPNTSEAQRARNRRVEIVILER